MSEIDFNYAAWPANTRVTLCNVPWNSDYRDIVSFADQAALDKYLSSNAGPSIQLDYASYHRPGTPIRLDVPLGAAYSYNYLRVDNPAQPVNGDKPRTYYYFITGTGHLAPNTTEFAIQLDVWQTFGRDVEFGNCFIERGHIGVANENAFFGYGRDYLTVPEGLDVGGEYEVLRTFTRQIATARSGGNGYSILVLSTVAIDEDPGNVDAPKLKTATGNALENLPNGTEAYVFNSMAEFNVFLGAFADKPWITQGIISVTAIPANAAIEYGMSSTAKRVAGMTIKEVNGGSLKNLRKTMGNGWRDIARSNMPQRYQHLDKLLTYPYTVLEMTSHTGTPLVLKPESWDSPDMVVVEMPHFAQPGPRIMFYPYRYNAAVGAPVIEDANGVVNDGGEFLDMATGIYNFPTFAIVNNSYISFMASNVNNIAFQHSSAEWSQQRALAGNQAGYNQASSGIATSQELSGIGIDQARQQATLSNTMSAVNGGIGALKGAAGGMRGGPGAMAMGAAGSIMGATMDIAQREASTAINASAAQRSNAATTGNMGYVRDSNKGYADMAAQGDYGNAIAGINAKVQDAQLIQPTTSGQVGGDAFLLAQYRWGYDIKIKRIQAAAMARVGEFMLRYGYSVHRFIKPPKSLQAMSNFTYWKMSETYLISSRCPESFKQSIRGIFEKGVTVWSNPNHIGRIDNADNYPLKGIRF